MFYVRDMFGLKVTHAGKLRKIERELRDALMTPEQRAAAKKKAEAAKKKAEADKTDGKPAAAGRKRKPKPKAKAPTA